VNVTDTLAVLAAGWGVLTAASPVLQIRRMVERRSSADLSLSYFSVLMVGFTVWAAYGISLGNLAIVLPNSVAFIVGLVTIVIALRYRSGARG